MEGDDDAAAVRIRRALVIDPHPEAAAGLGQQVAALGFDTGIMATRDLPLLLREEDAENRPGEDLLPDVALVRLNRITAGAVAGFLRDLRNLPTVRRAKCFVLAVTDVHEPVGRVEAWLARGVDDFLTDPLRMADGELLGARLAVAESQLRQREANTRITAAESARGHRLEHLFQQSTFGLIILRGPEACVLELNAAATRLLGYSSDSLIQQPLVLLLPHLLGRAYAEDATPSGWQAPATGYLKEICHPRPDGSTVFLETSLTPLPGWAGKNEAALLTLHDCTSQRLHTARLAHDARQETACQVLSGTARHLGDTLTAIRGNLELLAHQPAASAAARHPNNGPPRDDLTQHAREACDRAVAFSKRLTMLARLSQGGHLRRLPVDMRALLETTVPFALLNRRAKPVITTAPDLWPVEADDSSLAELLRCLTVNADEAMPGGGSLHFLAENVSPLSGHDADLPQAQIRLSIRDEGHGVRPEDMPVIFDPWFTTRPGREGMGLAVVAGIVKAHGGRITVESDAANGTTFTLWLPAIPAPLPGSEGPADAETDGNSPPFSPAPPPLRRSRTRILLMDDDGGVRLVMERILSRAGYEVYGTRDGREAVEAFRNAVEFGSPFELLLVDLDVRDGMGGLECVALLRSEFPGIRALLTTGCLDHPIMETYPDHGLLGVIPKPFQIDAFLRSMAQLIGKTI